MARCTFRKGWFQETLSNHSEPAALAFLDVDYQSSIHDCLIYLWPHLIEQGYLFTADYTHLDICAVFYSEEFWEREFGSRPPGLIGAGSGICLGQFWVGPFVSMGGNPVYPIQAPSSTAYTRKVFPAIGATGGIRTSPELLDTIPDVLSSQFSARVSRVRAT